MSEDIVVVKLDHYFYVFCKKNWQEIYWNIQYENAHNISHLGKFIPRNDTSTFQYEADSEDLIKIKNEVSRIGIIENKKNPIFNGTHIRWIFIALPVISACLYVLEKLKI